MPSAMPPRSRLYSLEPIGIGTRKQKASPATLAVSPQRKACAFATSWSASCLRIMRRPHLADGRHADLFNNFWRSETRALNSTGSLARRMVRGLEEETGRRDLRFFTFLTWSQVLPVNQLQKTTRGVMPHALSTSHCVALELVSELVSLLKSPN